MSEPQSQRSLQTSSILDAVQGLTRQVLYLTHLFETEEEVDFSQVEALLDEMEYHAQTAKPDEVLKEAFSDLTEAFDKMGEAIRKHRERLKREMTETSKSKEGLIAYAKANYLSDTVK